MLCINRSKRKQWIIKCLKFVISNVSKQYLRRVNKEEKSKKFFQRNSSILKWSEILYFHKLNGNQIYRRKIEWCYFKTEKTWIQGFICEF